MIEGRIVPEECQEIHNDESEPRKSDLTICLRIRTGAVGARNRITTLTAFGLGRISSGPWQWGTSEHTPLTWESN